MKTIDKSSLRKYKDIPEYGSKSTDVNLRDFKTESKRGKISIFLSHKHEESDLLENAIIFLKQFGIEVYVDWQDEGMPKHTSGITAKKIKKQIKENEKFVFLATEGAIASKWCNWELGLGDADKYIKDIALFPVSNDNMEFSGAEYLQIYPYIEYNDLYHTEECFVIYPDGSSKTIQEWLGSYR